MTLCLRDAYLLEASALKAKGYCSQDGFHRINLVVAEMAADPFPKLTFINGFRPRCLKQPATQFQCLIDEKSQHHQGGKNNRQILFAHAVVVSEIIAEVLHGVEYLIFDSPSCPAGKGNLLHVVDGQGEIGNPTECPDLFILAYLQVMSPIS